MGGPGGLTADQLTELVQCWTERGVVNAEQAAQLRNDVEAAQRLASPEPRTTRAVEALAYLGSAVVLAGASLLVARWWPDLGAPWRLLLVAVPTAALLLGGLLVPVRGPGAAARLRDVLWFASTGGAAGTLGVLAADVLDLGTTDALVLVAAGTAAYAGALWGWSRSPAQQVAAGVALALAAAAVVHRVGGPDDLPGVGAWLVGAVWASLGWLDALTPHRLALVLGSATALAGALATSGADAGLWLALLTVTGTVTIAVVGRDLVVLAVGAVGAFLVLPAALSEWFPDSAGAAVGLVVVGLVLVAVAVSIARLGGRAAPR